MKRASSRAFHPFRVLPLLLLILGVLAVAFYEPVIAWLEGDGKYDREAIIEWIEETRNSQDTLPEMVEDYLQELHKLDAISLTPPLADDPNFHRWHQIEQTISIRQEEIHDHLETLGMPSTKMFPGQLLLFPTFFRLEVQFQDPRYPPILWDAEIPIRIDSQASQSSPSSPYRILRHPIASSATIVVVYQLHAYRRQHWIMDDQKRRIRQVLLLLGAATLLTGMWLFLMQRRDGERERQRELASQLAEEAHLQKEETERKLLQQRLAAQAAEQHVLELRSQLYASIGIMAGSYAHNIKNLLVRPNDLIQRCLESQDLSPDQVHMLGEVRQTLGMVNDRLQQILRTVRRDPNRSDRSRFDLNTLLNDTRHTWVELALDKWKMELLIEPADGELWIDGDESQLQQAVENLLFNARDATFEMRNHLRNQARMDDRLDPQDRRQALIAAASWRGRVVIRTGHNSNQLILEVADNGIGMTDEVREKCTTTHFTTKRDNALYEGHNTGTGLGLAFVSTIVEHHGGRLLIASEPLKGAVFRLVFPASGSLDSTAVAGGPD